MNYLATFNTEVRELDAVNVKLWERCLNQDNKTKARVEQAQSRIAQWDSYCRGQHQKWECTSLTDVNGEAPRKSTELYMQLFRVEAAKALADPNYSADFGEIKGAARVTNAPTANAAPTPPLSKDCDLVSVEKTNTELGDIDERVGAFLASPDGLQQGSVTPSLQAIMWATQEQSRIIKALCPGGAGFKEMLAAREATFKQAQTACKQINSSPQQCVPKIPEDVIADYDKVSVPGPAQKSGGNAIEKPPVADTRCPKGLGADAKACLVSQCKQEGGAAYVSDKCISCGDGTGSKGEGFLWETCMDGTSSAR